MSSPSSPTSRLRLRRQNRGLMEKKDPGTGSKRLGTQILALPLRTCIVPEPQFSHL